MPSTAVGAQRNREMADADLSMSSWPLIHRRPVASNHQGRELLRVYAGPGDTARRRLADPPVTSFALFPEDHTVIILDHIQGLFFD